jgi:hypothetical protein
MRPHQPAGLKQFSQIYKINMMQSTATNKRSLARAEERIEGTGEIS